MIEIIELASSAILWGLILAMSVMWVIGLVVGLFQDLNEWPLILFGLVVSALIAWFSGEVVIHIIDQWSGGAVNVTCVDS